MLRLGRISFARDSDKDPASGGALDHRAGPAMRRPVRWQRLLVASAAAIWGATWFLIEAPRYRTEHTDFGQAWFGARAFAAGTNPYPLVGPGGEFDTKWPMLYPGPAFVVALPFAPFSEVNASLAFVCISSFLLAFGMTRQSWHLLPLFASEAFMSSARLAQWSIIFTAALFLPWLAFLTVAKPQAGAPVLAAAGRDGLRTAGIAGAVVLLISLVLLPQWPSDWLESARTAAHMRPPILRLGGIFVLLALTRWRRREAWLLVTLACVPQTWGWYNHLMLFTVPVTFRESAFLVIITALAYVFGPYFVGNLDTASRFEASVGALQVATAYLPATILVLRRPNEGVLPAWLDLLMRQFKRSR